MILNIWGRLDESIRIEELCLEIRNPLPDDFEYLDEIEKDLRKHFKSGEKLQDYLNRNGIFFEEDDSYSYFLKNVILMELIPDNKIFQKSTLCEVNGGFPFLFCEDFIEERILALIKFIADVDYSRLPGAENFAWDNLPYLCEVYPIEYNRFHPKYSFKKGGFFTKYIVDTNICFISSLRNLFKNIDNFLQVDKNNYYKLDLILDAIQSINKNEGTKQAILPCFSIIESTVVTNDFRDEVDKVIPYAFDLFKNPSKDIKTYLDDIAVLRNKLIHGEYLQFYSKLKHIHAVYFDSAKWDSSEQTPLNWCLGFVFSDIEKICSNILYSKFVNNL